MRLDQRLVAEGHAASRSKAHSLIESGVVLVDGVIATKPGAKMTGTLEVGDDPCPWVSRAALKLLHAIEHFQLNPSGIAMDVGASTGGFTEVLLSRGINHVHAIDVGHDQLHPDLARDPRVSCHDGVNARDVPTDLLPEVDWITMDLSFISLAKVLPSVVEFAGPGAHLVALVKPQFEAGREHIGKGGVVTDPETHARVVSATADLLENLGWQVLGQTESPILGGDGNREFLLAARNGP